MVVCRCDGMQTSPLEWCVLLVCGSAILLLMLRKVLNCWSMILLLRRPAILLLVMGRVLSSWMVMVLHPMIIMIMVRVCRYMYVTLCGLWASGDGVASIRWVGGSGFDGALVDKCDDIGVGL